MKEKLQERHTRTKPGRGQGGKTTADQLELLRMSSLTTLPKANESESWKPLPWLSVKEYFQDHLMEPWLKAQSEVPFHISHRPSDQNDRPNPTKDEDGELGRALSRQYRAYKNSDSNPKQKIPSPSASSLKSSKIKQQRPNKP